MPFYRIFTAILFLTASCISLGWAEEGFIRRKPVPILASAGSERLPLMFRSENAVENLSRLSFCEKTMMQLQAKLGLPAWTKTRFLIIWDEKASDSVWADTFARNLRSEDGQWIFTIQGLGDWNAGKEQLCRTLAICVLQAYMLPEKAKGLPNDLPEPPFWLSEGLTQMLMESRREDFAATVWRFSLAKKVPSLNSIQGWTELSQDGIRRSWQQAFSFWLATQATRSPAEKSTLKMYLFTYLKEPEKPYWGPESLQEEWWQRSASLALKQDVPGYDWQQSVAHLREATFISLRYKGDEGERLISITELPKSTLSLQTLDPIKEARQRLAELQVRCHPLLIPVAMYYRNALEAWEAGKIDLYAWNLRAARDQQKETTQLRESANDFLDWFTVNYDLDTGSADHLAYAQRVEELENARKDFRMAHSVKTRTE